MTEGRGRVQVLRDPATAIAAAKCFLSRTQNRLSLGAFHSEECDFCETSLDVLIRALEEFGTWSGISYRETRYDPLNPALRAWRPEIESFAQLPREEQLKMVEVAQGYRDDDASSD